MTDDPTPSEQNNPTSDDMRLAEEWANSGRTVGALPRRQRPQRPTPRTTSQPPVSSPATHTPAPKKPQTATTTQPGRQRINVTVYVVPALHEQLRSRSAATGVTVSDLVVQALAFVADHAAKAVADDLRVETVPGDEAGLFDVTPSRPVGVAKTQLGVRMTRHNKDGLDQLTRTSGARDRSHLVSVAVRDYLDSNPVKKGRHVR
ncbi:CopG family transcriptional regulator [Propionibacterium sp. HMSC068C01]|nr:CopG family transcriptional regulator [Propionibacterium sp. HMSC068C01]